MRVGVPRERMPSEHRVALTPAGARELASHGHEVLVERDAGAGSGLRDDDYAAAGARIVPLADDAWEADLVLKVKEPLEPELGYLRPDLVVFTYLHLAAHRTLTERLVASSCIAIGYETVQLPDGRLPLLAPMSEIAGRMAPQVGAHYLEKEHGAGILLGGVSGVRPARVVIIGSGTAGRNAAFLAAGMEAEVLLFDKNVDRLREVDAIHQGRIMTLYSHRQTVEEAVRSADLVISAVLVTGARAPVLIPEALVKQMRRGSVLIDLSIDQGGSAETSHVTTHQEPTYVVHDVIHYCVGNMPGAVPHTSTYALTNATLPYAEEIADLTPAGALRRDPTLARGVNVYRGRVTNPGVAEAHGLELAPLEL